MAKTGITVLIRRILTMDINTIMQLVGSLGAPIVMAFVLLKMMKENADKHDSEVRLLVEQHSKDMKDMTDEIHKNNVEVIQKLGDVAVALTQLCDTIENKSEE